MIIRKVYTKVTNKINNTIYPIKIANILLKS